jgi:putative CocE/NonD family hydrolase
MPFFRLALLVPALALLCQAANTFDIPAHYVKSEHQVPMRDGTKLFTQVYAPKDTSEKWPILLNRTPYNVAPYGPGKYRKALGPSAPFAADKFIFVYQDVRGRFMSEGEFVDERPIKDAPNGPKDIDESTDTYDTIEWLLKSVPNNNGKVGQYGISYPGFYTDSGLVRAHPALLAASPQAPMADVYMGDDAYHNGALMLLANFGFYVDFPKQNNPVAPPAKETEYKYGTKDGYQFYLKMGPVANSEKLINKNQYWTDTYEHDTYDDFWKPRNLLPHLKGITPAVLVVGGWYDPEDLSGAIKTFRAISAQSPEAVASLVMGPWQHGGWNRSDGSKLGDIAFGAKTSEFYHDQVELPFFQHYLKQAQTPSLPKAVVFKTGKNEWNKLPQWPPTGKAQRLYLQAHGALTLQPPIETSGMDEYVSNPNDPVPFSEKPTLEMRGNYMLADQRFVQSRKDVLTYMTDVLTEDTTIAGPVSPTLFVSTTGTDSDFDVKVIDVYPNDAPGAFKNYEQLVRGEPFRGKFRNSFEHPEPFTPGAVQQIHFSMPDVYHCFLKGHRIMVQIQSSWFPLTDRNPQTFTNIPHAKPEEFVKATERVYRSQQAASFVEVNVAQ